VQLLPSLPFESQANAENR